MNQYHMSEPTKWQKYIAILICCLERLFVLIIAIFIGTSVFHNLELVTNYDKIIDKL